MVRFSCRFSRYIGPDWYLPRLGSVSARRSSARTGKSADPGRRSSTRWAFGGPTSASPSAMCRWSRQSRRAARLPPVIAPRSVPGRSANRTQESSRTNTPFFLSTILRRQHQRPTSCPLCKSCAAANSTVVAYALSRDAARRDDGMPGGDRTSPPGLMPPGSCWGRPSTGRSGATRRRHDRPYLGRSPTCGFG